MKIASNVNRFTELFLFGGIQAAAAVSQFLIMFFIITSYGHHSFGTYSVFLSLTALFALVLSSGLPQFIFMETKFNDLNAMFRLPKGLQAKAIFVYSITVIFVSICSVLFADNLAQIFGVSKILIFVSLSTAIILSATTLLASVLRKAGFTVSSYILSAGGRPILLMVILASLSDVNSIETTYALISATLLVVTFWLVYRIFEFRDHRMPQEALLDHRSTKSILSFFLINCAGFGFLNIAVLVGGAILLPEEVSHLKTALQFSVIMGLFEVAIRHVFMRKILDRSVNSYKNTVLTDLLKITRVVGIPLCLVASCIAYLFYSLSPAVMIFDTFLMVILLSAGRVCEYLIGTFDLVLEFSGKEWVLAKISLLAIISSALISLILGLQFGVEGIVSSLVLSRILLKISSLYFWKGSEKW